MVKEEEKSEDREEAKGEISSNSLHLPWNFQVQNHYPNIIRSFLKSNFYSNSFASSVIHQATCSVVEWFPFADGRTDTPRKNNNHQFGRGLVGQYLFLIKRKVALSYNIWK